MPSAEPSRRQVRKQGSNNRVGKQGGEAMLPARSPRQEDLALGCQSRMEEGGIVPPHSVLAPGTALGLLPSRALPSAQVNCMVAQGQRTLEFHRDRKETERTTIRPGCSIRVAWQLEIPP